MKFIGRAIFRPLFICLVVVPFFAGCIYFCFLARDRYVSISHVVVRHSSEIQSPQAGGFAALLHGMTSPSREETLYVREFIGSLDMLNELQAELNFRQHYEGRFSDPFFWLPAGAPIEDVLKFYNRVVKAHFDDVTGLLRIEVQAFDSAFAQQVVNSILRRSEIVVNELSQKIARDQMAFAEAELRDARERLDATQRELLEFQSKNNYLDAQASATSRGEVIATLEGELVKERAILKDLLSTLNPAAPQVRQKRSRIGALEQQLIAESKKLLSTPEGGQLNVVASDYKNLKLSAEFALESYKLAVMSVERTRVDSVKKVRSLVVVLKPAVAESAIYPRAAYNLLTLMLGLLMFYAIVRFLIASVKDHQD